MPKANEERDFEVIRRQQPEFVREFSALPIFADVCREAVEALCRSIQIAHVEPDALIVSDGHNQESLLVVKEGNADVFVRGQLVRSLMAGEFVGDTKFLGIKRSGGASVIAKTRCTICELTRDSFIRSLAKFPMELKKFEAIRTQHQSCMSVGIMTQTCELLCGLSMKTLIAIDSSTVDRFFFPGECILREGTPGAELCLLVTGRVSVKKTGSSQRSIECQGQIACFGELPFLGIRDTYNTSVYATSLCLVRILHRSVLSKVLGQQREALHLKQVKLMLERSEEERQLSPEFGTSPRRGLLYELDISDDFLDFIAENCEEQVYLDEQVIIDPEAFEKAMFLVTSGTAKIVVEGAERNDPENVEMLQRGGIVGEHAALGFTSQFSARVIAVGTCCMWKISEQVLITGLRKFPQECDKLLLLACSSRAHAETVSHVEMTKDLLMAQRHAVRRKSMQDIVHKAMRASRIFATVSSDFVNRLADIARFGIYLPGDLIMEEGEKGDSMFIVISGEASVLVRTAGAPEQVGKLGGGSLCGELTMLGVSLTRTATVKAATICTVWEVKQQSALALLDDLPDQIPVFENMVVRNLEHTVLGCIQHVPLFGPFDSKFKTLIYMYCERRAYWAGARLAEQGEPGNGLIVINRGMATLQAQGCTIAMCTDGYCFGAGLMLGLQKLYPCSLISLQMCHVLIVSRESYILARDRYPAHSEAKLLEVCQKKEIQKFNRMVHLAMKARPSSFSTLEDSYGRVISEMEVVRTCWDVWQEHVRHVLASRENCKKVESINKEATVRWLGKITAAREQRKQAELELSFEGKRHERGSVRRRPKKRRSSSEHPYVQDLVYLMEEAAPPRSPSPGGRQHFRQDVRSVAAAERHIQRLGGKSKHEENSTLSPAESRVKRHGKAEDSSDGAKLPPLLLHLAPRKAVMDASLLQPVLIRDHLPPIMKSIYA